MPIVRLYPVGEVSPQPLPNAPLNVPAADDINLFGGNQAQDLQVAGQRLGQASDSVFAIYERKAKEANDIRVQNANNQYITGEREILRTGPDAYYKQSGAEAIVGAGETIERLTKLKDQLLGQAPNDYQRQRLGPILDTHLALSTEAVARHADAQQAAYGRTVAASAIETSRADAVANPANLPNSLVRAVGATRVLFQGQAPEIVEQEARKAEGSVVSAVIGDRLGRNDPEGLALFRQYRDRLDPRDRRVLGAAAEMLTNTVAAADWLRDRSARLAAPPTGDAALDAVTVASASVAEPSPVTSWGGMLLSQEGVVGHRQRMTGIEHRRRALTALNEQEFAGDPVRRRANQTAIDTDTAWNRAAAKAEADKAYADLQHHLTTGGPGGGPAVTLPPATLLSRFTDAQQDTVAAQVNRTIEGKKTRTDQPTWYAIHQGLTSDDADERERWADINLVQFRGQLSDEDFASLNRLQTTMRTNDGGAEATRQQAIMRMSNRALLAAGINPTPTQDRAPEGQTMQAATFRRALDDELSTFESSKGRPATAADAQDIVGRLATTAVKGGWLAVNNRNDSLTVASDIPLTDDAFHRDGVQVAQAEGPAVSPPEQRQLMTIGVDFERLRRMREEEEQREPADQRPDGTVDSDGVHGTEPDPSSLEYRIADAHARDIVRAEDAKKAGSQSGGAPPTEPDRAFTTEPDPGSPEYQAADAQARNIVAEQAAERLGGQGLAPTEPPPGSPEYRTAYSELERLEAERQVDRIETERMITQWMKTTRPEVGGSFEIPNSLPSELIRRLDPEQRQAIDDVISNSASSTTDPQVFTKILKGLTSHSVNERIYWAREPLYRYRPSLSPDDFHKLAMLQHVLGPRDGNSRTGALGHPVGTLEDHVKLLLAIAMKRQPRPAGIPKNWILKPTKKHEGTRYTDPNNPNNIVRVSPGNARSLFPNSRRPYIVRQKNGKFYDKDGRVVAKNSPDSHIHPGDISTLETSISKGQENEP